MEKVLIVDCSSGEVYEEELSAEDKKQKQIDIQAGLELDSLLDEQKRAKEVLLEKLGITEDEAKLLLS